MSFKIGFNAEDKEKVYTQFLPEQEKASPRKSIVEVYFASRGRSWSYYNDSFDLRKGDIVFVEGKLEGKRGVVVDVNYNFKIKLSDYKRVIAAADTEVRGEVFLGGSHLIAFNSDVIPYEKIVPWFKAPVNPEDDIVRGMDDSFFLLDELENQNIPHKIFSGGYEYYYDNKVVYIELDGENGRAIVEGSEFYEVEFKYKNGEISGLVCNCYCSYTCKHDVAVMLQLKDMLMNIEKNYSEKYEKSGYFAAISKADFFAAVVDTKEKGSIAF